MKLEQAALSAESDLEAISRALRGARLAKSALAGFPGRVPESLEAAYKIQKKSIEAWPNKVVGWKVGGVAPEFQGSYKADRLAGPIFSNQVQTALAEGTANMAVFRDGFAAVEPEFVLELGDVSQFEVENATPETISTIVHKCYTGIEVASSPVPDINGYGPTAIVSDFGNNHGLLLGQEIPNWDAELLAQIAVSTEIDGVLVGEACAHGGLKGPLGAVLFLVRQLRSTDIPVPKGLLVSTGAITGVHEAVIGSHSRITFAEHGQINLELVGH